MLALVYTVGLIWGKSSTIDWVAQVFLWPLGPITAFLQRVAAGRTTFDGVPELTPRAFMALSLLAGLSYFAFWTAVSCVWLNWRARRTLRLGQGGFESIQKS